MRVKVEVSAPGLHSSEVVVKIQTAEGEAVFLTQHRDSVNWNSVEVGYPVGRREGAYLVEFSRELDHGPWRAWVPLRSLLDEHGCQVHPPADDPRDDAELQEALDDLDHQTAYGRARQRIDGQRLYVDLDGVLADFDSHFPATFNVHHNDIEDDVLWRHILSVPSFYSDLPVCKGATEAFRQLERWYGDPIILTACPKSDYENAALRKRAWVRRHISAKATVLPVLGGTKKYLFMHAPGDILIDDFDSNIDKWIAAYGIGILHEGDWAQTLERVSKARI